MTDSNEKNNVSHFAKEDKGKESIFLTKKKLIAGFIIFAILSFGGGYLTHFLISYPDNNEEGNGIDSCSPTIDGDFSKDDGWEMAKWQFIEYIELDDSSNDTNNYFYVHLKNSTLYILIDFFGDVSGDMDGEWISIWLDTDNSKENYGESGWNDSLSDGGHQMLCYLPEWGSFNKTYTDWMGNEYASTLNSSDTEISIGFQSSKNYEPKHRIFELAIDINATKINETDNFNIGFLGYGTAYHYEVGYWGAPTLFSHFHYNYEWIDEDSYFECKV